MLNVPVGWEVKQLGDVAVINPGINKSMSHMGSGVLYVTVQDLYSGDSIDIKRLGRIRLSTQEVDSYALQPRDIIFGKSSVKREGIAYPNIFRGALEPVVCTGFSYMVRALPELADADFLLHALRWSPTRKWLIEHSQASALTNINKAISDAIPITLPPLEEQQRIGTILSDMDAHANAMARLLAKKKAVKAAMAEELLTGKRRLEGFSGAWEVKTLNELADIDPEQLRGDTNPDYLFKYISLEDVDLGVLRGYSLQTFQYAPSRARRNLRPGDILVSTVRPSLKSHLLFQETSENWVGSTGFSVIRCIKGLSHPEYVFAHLFSECISRQINILLTGSNYPAINSRDVRLLKIPVPGLEEQIAIATILSDMDADIQALAKKLEKHKKLKEAMAHQLLTGAIRV